MRLLLFIAVLFVSILSIAAEKDRGYCGRVVKPADFKEARMRYEAIPDYAFILIIQCNSEVIEANTSIEDLKFSSDTGYAVIWTTGGLKNGDERLNNFAKNRSNICVRARWGSPGPCSGGSQYDGIYTNTDYVHSIVYRSSENFPERYYPYGEFVR